MHQKKIAEIVTNLKRVREENGLSYQKIVEMVENNGEYVSLSTVRRVFEDGSESYGFQFDNTLRPIANAVLGIYCDTDVVSASEVEALKSIVSYKSDRIAELESQLKRTEDSYRRRLDFLKHQISLKDERIDKRDAMIERLLNVILDQQKQSGV